TENQDAVEVAGEGHVVEKSMKRLVEFAEELGMTARGAGIGAGELTGVGVVSTLADIENLRAESRADDPGDEVQAAAEAGGGVRCRTDFRFERRGHGDVFH